MSVVSAAEGGQPSIAAQANQEAFTGAGNITAVTGAAAAVKLALDLLKA